MLAESTRYPLRRLGGHPRGAQLESPFCAYGWCDAASRSDRASDTREGAQQAATFRGNVANRRQAGRGLRLLVDGPSSTVPSAVNREPCKRQSQDFSRSLKRTMPPRCVQMAETAQVLPATVEIATGSPPSPTTPTPSGVRSSSFSG